MNPEDAPATAEETPTTATPTAEGQFKYVNDNRVHNEFNPVVKNEQTNYGVPTPITVTAEGDGVIPVPVNAAGPAEAAPETEQHEETGAAEQNPQLEVMRQMLEQMQQMLNQMQQNQENMMRLIEAMVTRQNEHEDRLNQQNQQQEAPQAEEVPNDNDPDQEPAAPNQQAEQPAAGIVVAPEAAEPQVVVAAPAVEATLAREEEPQVEQQNRLRRFWNRLRGEYYGAGTAFITGRVVTPEQQGETRRSRLLKRGLAAALLVGAGYLLAKGLDGGNSNESTVIITDGTPGLEGDGTNGLGGGGPAGGEAGGFDHNKGRSHIDFVGEQRISGVELPPELEMTRNAEGKLHIVNNHGNEIVPPLESIQDQQGNLSQEAKEILRSKGFKLKQDTLLENRFMTSVSS